jgi:hypothetical protein
MNGRNESFSVGEVSVKLARPSFSEMAGVVAQIDEAQTTAEIATLLLRAAVNEDKEALEKAIDEADHEQVMALWNEWLEFAGYEDFIEAWEAPRLKRQARQQAVMFRAMKAEGLISEDFLENFTGNMMLSSEPSTSDTPTPTAGRPLS